MRLKNLIFGAANLFAGAASPLSLNNLAKRIGGRPTIYQRTSYIKRNWNTRCFREKLIAGSILWIKERKGEWCAREKARRVRQMQAGQINFANGLQKPVTGL